MYELNWKNNKERPGRRKKAKTFSLTFIQETRWFHDILQLRKKSIIYLESTRTIQKWQQTFKRWTIKKYKVIILTATRIHNGRGLDS